MTYELRPYQERAVQEAIKYSSRYEAFDMGLGKTLIMLDYLKRTGQKALVIAPMEVAIRTWPQEILKFTPDATFSVMHGPNKKYLYGHDADVKIINYDGLAWLQKQAFKNANVLRNRVLILDEATAIKNPSSQRFKILQSMLKANIFTRVFCLSGTPLPNGYKDLWAPYWTIDRGVALGTTMSAFRRRYFIESGPPRWQVALKEGSIADIQGRIAPITSVLRAEDHLSMPESIYIDKEVELTKEAMDLYKVLVKDKVTTWHGEEIVTETAASLTMKLRQITQGAIYSSADSAKNVQTTNLGTEKFIPTHDVKLAALEELLEEAQGSPILCPINFRFEVTQIRRKLDYEVPCIYSGTKRHDRTKWLNDWDEGKIPLLLCHPASLSHGLNMQTGGHIIVWYGIPWSLEHYKQLNGRLIRPGQKNSVRVYFLKAKDTIDEKVASVLANKEATEQDFKEAMLIL